MAKAGYASIDGTARKIKSIYVSVNGVARKVKAAYIGVDGKARQWYSSGLSASSLAVGSSVYLNEGGSYVEYLVVNQGIPQNSSLYDASCDGTWLLRRHLTNRRNYGVGSYNEYNASGINTYLNGDFYNSLGEIERSTIKQVKIPYNAYYEIDRDYYMSVRGGASGLSCKIFLPSVIELKGSTSNYGAEGAKLSGGFDLMGRDNTGALYPWWTRSPKEPSNYRRSYDVGYIDVNGNVAVMNANNTSNTAMLRPALILPLTATFDPATMRLIG